MSTLTAKAFRSWYGYSTARASKCRVQIVQFNRMRAFRLHLIVNQWWHAVVAKRISNSNQQDARLKHHNTVLRISFQSWIAYTQARRKQNLGLHYLQERSRQHKIVMRFERWREYIHHHHIEHLTTANAIKVYSSRLLGRCHAAWWQIAKKQQKQRNQVQSIVTTHLQTKVWICLKLWRKYVDMKNDLLEKLRAFSAKRMHYLVEFRYVSCVELLLPHKIL
ncbi:hypothetical protein AC1031_001443 [Aphanomyces cochlioides]|nr:hypothetical protein AC1031_001443 [Aphanomyces cochlioides]